MASEPEGTMKGIMSSPPHVNLLVGSAEEKSRDLPAEQGSVQWAQAPRGEQDARLGRAGSQDSPAGMCVACSWPCGPA